MRNAVVSKILLAMVVAGLPLVACNKVAQQAEDKPSGPPPVHVQVVPVKSMALQRSVRISGSLAGLETSTLSNRVAGRITKVYVDRGDRVKPGQVLLEVEPDRFKMGVDESQATLQQTLARLGLETVPSQEFDVNQTAPVKKAKSEYDLAKDKMDRATPLNQSKAMNDFEYMDIVSTFRAAESTLEASRDEARALLAQARQNQAEVQMRSKDFTDSQILAPAGTTPSGEIIESFAISDRKVSEGEYIREGSPLFTLVADRTLKLQAHVPERFLGDVRKDAPVTFRVEAYPDEVFEGKVSTINPAVDEASRTFMIEALVDNAHYGNRLRPGSFVPGEVLTKKQDGCVMVPLEAITSFVGVTKIYKLDPADNPPKKVKAVEITTGQQEAITDADGKVQQWVEIVSTGKGQELTAKDKVVVSGSTKLVDGSPILLDEKNTATAPAPASAAAQASTRAGE